MGCVTPFLAVILNGGSSPLICPFFMPPLRHYVLGLSVCVKLYVYWTHMPTHTLSLTLFAVCFSTSSLAVLILSLRWLLMQHAMKLYESFLRLCKHTVDEFSAFAKRQT